jgi:hypothetical protein
LRLDGTSGPLLARGLTDDESWNRMLIAYDPVAKQLSARINGIALGPFPVVLAAPRDVGFEGVGILDNFVVRRLN